MIVGDNDPIRIINQLTDKSEYAQNIGNLDYKTLLYIIKEIIALERPGLEKNFLPMVPKVLIPNSPEFIYADNVDDDSKIIPDIIVYRTLLLTGANLGGNKQPHKSPMIQTPVLYKKFEDNAGNVFDVYKMLYDVTIQFDFFSKTYLQLTNLTDWFRHTMFLYRDFIKMMGTSEFVFRAQYEDTELRSKYAKFSIYTNSMEFFTRLHEFYIVNTTKTQEFDLTINDVKRKINGGQQ